MSNQDHIEVAPRMWDYTIAATSTPKEADIPNEPAPIINEPAVVNNVAASGLLMRLKTYLIPIAFILGVIIVVYVLWKYFTKYRNKKNAQALNVAQSSDNEDPSLKTKPTDPAHIIEHEDMSKFEYESDEEEKPRVRFNQRFETIEEETSDDEESESTNANSSDEDSANSETSSEASEDASESNPEMPNIADIERMIEENTNNTNMNINPDADMFSLKNAYVTPQETDPTTTSHEIPKSSKSRKMKRVTL